jgi:CheY-like chemotaxis protein
LACTRKISDWKNAITAGKRSNAAGTGVVAMPANTATANALHGDRELCLAAGMDGYVTKPIRVDALVHALTDTSPRGSTSR